MDIPRKLLPLLQKKKRIKVVYGGRGGTKTLTISDMMLMYAQTKGEKIGCFREIQKSIEDSVHATLKAEIERLRLQGFDVMANKIRHESGGEFTYDGLTRNPSAIKSKHGYSKFWTEEAENISEESLELILPTLRVVKPMYDDDPLPEDVEFWFSFNPKSAGDPISQRFIVPYQETLDRVGYYEDDLHLIIKVNYTDNPFWKDSGLEATRSWDYENKPRAVYDHIWLGAFNDEIDNSIIPAEWFDAAIDAHVKLGFEAKGVKLAAHDPSDLGPDSKGYALRHGVVLTHCEEKETADVNEGADWATDLAIQHDADMFTYDADGLGVTLRRQVNDNLNGKGIRIEAFKGSEGVDDPDKYYQGRDEYADESKPKTNKETFKNKRAQKYWGLRDRFYAVYRAVEHGEYIDPDELISISSKIQNITKLRSEICRIPRKPNGAGLIQIMNKQEMKTKHKIKSPNLADSVYMAYGVQPKPAKKTPQHIPMKFAQRA